MTPADRMVPDEMSGHGREPKENPGRDAGMKSAGEANALRDEISRLSEALNREIHDRGNRILVRDYVEMLRAALAACHLVFGNQLAWETIRKDHPIVREVEE
jgi:hypothetical protein